MHRTRYVKFFVDFWDFIVDIVFPDPEEIKERQKILASLCKLQIAEKDWNSKYLFPCIYFWNYKDRDVRKAIRGMKYSNQLRTADFFADLMYEQLCDGLSQRNFIEGFDKPILTPIPMTSKRQLERGYNQSAAICKALFCLDQGNFFEFKPNVLYKIKDTGKQARLKDRLSRLKNLKDSFGLKDAEVIRNRNIILVDDVLTTGATLTEASKVLLSGGAKNIVWLTIAH